VPDRREKFLKVICAVFGAVLALQLALFVAHATFSRGLTVPALPSLPPELDAQAGKTTNAPAGTNAIKSGTNVPSTNALTKGKTNSLVTNSPPTPAATTNSPSSDVAGTNVDHAKIPLSGTNSPDATQPQIVGPEITSTNASNVVASATKAATNSPSSKGPVKKGLPSGGRASAQSKIADLPAPIKERIERITQGEILAPVMRPLPMALLGIAGNSAFLRGADGQTGLVKEGDQLGSLKLLRIGTNRVLIEQDGEKKEPMIFAGLGSDTLLPKPDKTTNEPPKKSP